MRIIRVVFAAISFLACGQALATPSASDRPYFGVYLFGVTYSVPSGVGDVRLGVGMPWVLDDFRHFEGNVSLVRQGSTPGYAGPLGWHYGAGVSLTSSRTSRSGQTALRPHGLVGISQDYGAFTSYIELNAGPTFDLSGVNSVTFTPGFRAGLYFR